MSKLIPLNDKVIVKPVGREKTTESGIVLPDTVDKERPEQGKVIATGPGKMMDSGTRQAMSVKVGQKVLFTKYSPNEVEIEKEEYLVISESDILAIIE
ncbi:MAG: co-chaperone GroES [Candidatus Jacksonbacteria bacterium RIFOXYC2_FULL_44_29]|nr:MAG: 10 kDa chaperonin [Parcubacteria group bacterium GW2011_GWA2_42_28]KKT55836.1 MAG: 10 kDa chaperonin [Parcubacteria group bacterium GW2011_GWC2_44_22]OGY75615.1 MAG: co-chaperone GroES [Candidatus Jacksonbacteria bacterium RIFOXYA2_FULL_43_12]OGY76588.1 MAG: co-chaperone GroES [Candidatus Jacksonbacteria bacterium RIFOXYB2_FULL_44_15]OGY78313.1 MAG: co-chaperone GroES [Candidatus Jacksonbacteria bacterium RIFOXYC2_FULL_44_29]OGY81517.1 MAG: co-chaperone GroES [Candidatus Jacksonbacteri